jgi:geranylgeranyl pyrophosphate synthase
MSPSALAELEGEVATRAAAFLALHAVNARQHALLAAALDRLRARAADHGAPFAALTCVRVPLLVCAAVRGEAAPALPLAVAATLLVAGLDLLDDLMDGDLADGWCGYRPAELLLAGATLVAALPQLALGELPLPPDRLVVMQRALARAGLRISAGQQRDLRAVGHPRLAPAAAEAIAAGKSGEVLAVIAALAATLAGARPRAVAGYAALGRALGTALQLRSDCYDLFGAPRSRDLAAGARTLPLALYLRARPEERRPFLALLTAARTDPMAQNAVRARLIDADVPRLAEAVIARHCARAHAALDHLHPREPAAGALRALIDRCSLTEAPATRGGKGEDR